MKEGFSAQWLALRERADTGARSRSLARAFLDALPQSAHVLDLGAGAGANARYLAALAAGRAQQITWRLVDRDRALLDGSAGLPGAVRDVTDFADDPALLNLAGVDGISASALFDLVSRDWFVRFVNAVARRPLLLALTAYGDHRWHPADGHDAQIMGWFARDMQRDKGFGPAMGLAAPPIMAQCLADAGYRVQMVASDWHLNRDQPEMLNAMIDTIAGAAGDREGAAQWRRRRRQCAADGLLELVVEHRDILALSDGA
jgi:SAM-dependent methyltransferase